MQSVISLDPGGRSGWAAWFMAEDHCELIESGVLRQDLMARWLADQQNVGYGIIDNPPRFDVIVAESWRPYEINGSMNWIKGDPLLSAQHIGQIRLIADLSLTKYVEQAPSQKNVYRRSFPEVLASLDEESNEMHDQDARLHGWGYFFSQWFSARKDPERVVFV